MNQESITNSVRRLYQDYQNDDNFRFTKKPSTPKEYTINWFGIWAGDVGIVQLGKAIETVEAENAKYS